MGLPLGSDTDLPIVLGGHSFFSNLGNDPVPDEDLQAELVNRCLDRDICWFDTTHQPERSALGKALARIGRRKEATIIAWNFMAVLKPGDALDRPVVFEDSHLAMLLEQLQTDYIDCLVLHEIDHGTERDRKQMEEVAMEWQRDGVVRQLGCWAPGADAVEKYGADNPYTFMVRPYNIASKDAIPAFVAAKAQGWETFACSPFVRGWELDKMVDAGLSLGSGDPVALKARLADHMLRFSLFHPTVDRLINGIRKLAWIESNIESCRRGPLSDEERAWLREVRGALDKATGTK